MSRRFFIICLTALWAALSVTITLLVIVWIELVALRDYVEGMRPTRIYNYAPNQDQEVGR